MESVKQGSRSCLEVLIRRFGSRLLTFLTRLTGDLHTAEEVFQETFAAVWKRRSTYIVGRAVRPWLYTIAVNEFRRRGRVRTRQPVPIQEDLPALQGGDPSDHSEAVQLATRALATLGEREREVLVLSVHGGLSYAHIAESLSISESTARGYMLSALRKLRESMVAPRASTLATEVRS
jgi:RNA polymerase sigma-70 factor (ECF subfamily)